MVIFGHESCGFAVVLRDFFGGPFDDRVHIGGVDRVGIFRVDLFLASVGFAFGAFHWDACVVKNDCADRASRVHHGPSP